MPDSQALQGAATQTRHYDVDKLVLTPDDIDLSQSHCVAISIPKPMSWAPSIPVC